MSSVFLPSKWQFFIILGVAVSGIAAFINTYDAIAKIDSKLANCAESAALANTLKIRFIIMLVLSCLAIIIGIVLSWVLRNNPKLILTFGLITTGLLGIIYAVVTKYNKAEMGVKLGISWISLLAFVILGYLLDSGKLGGSIESNEIELTEIEK